MQSTPDGEQNQVTPPSAPSGEPTEVSSSDSPQSGSPPAVSSKKKWVNRVFKVIVFFAVLGSAVLAVSVYYITKMMNEISGSIGK